MRTITLTRQPPDGKWVRGTLEFAVNDHLRTFDTIENADYLIPEGTYPVDRTWSPKFKKLLPEILDVPDRSGIRIHMGSKPEHSTGCILTSLAGMSLLQVLFNQIEFNQEYKNQDETVTIRIIGTTQGLDQSPL